YSMSTPPAGVSFASNPTPAVQPTTLPTPPMTIPAIPPVTRPVTPSQNTIAVPSANSGMLAQQVLAAYILLSPNSKASIDGLIDKEHASSSSHWSNIQCALPFDLDDNAPVITPNASVPVSNLINNLADAGFHVPLTLFSRESLYKLQNQPLAVKTIKVHQKGQNVYILDSSQFPPESEMCPLDWYSAWEHYLEWIGACQGHIQKCMWSSHFCFLACKDKFVDYFPAILLFDIEICSS
ncbi:hypothetical protein EDC04DRAFT_2533499, partial [Pisolithus marmoratus]